MVKVLFIARKARSNSGRQILYCRISLAGITREISTGQELHRPELWNQDKQIYEDPDPEGDLVNVVCERLRVQIKRVYLKLEEEHGEVTPDRIIGELRRRKPKRMSLVDLVQIYIKHIGAKKMRNGQLRRASTVRHYEKYLANLQAFQGRSILLCGEVTTEWAERFKRWLATKPKPCRHKTRASRHVEFFKRALEHGVKQKLIPAQDLAAYDYERDPDKKVVFLTKDERMRFIEARFPLRELERCRAVFVYHFRMGVSYGDLWAKYEVKEFLVDNTPLKVIMGTRSKNGRQFFLPYDPEAEKILQVYDGKLPYITNTEYNKTLKILALMLGIDKHLVTHTARKTFIMTNEADGWSRETTQHMVAHKALRTTEKYYMEPSLERLLNEMARRAST